MKRKHKIYAKPKRPFDKARIDEEAIIKKEYGLKNKREIWKADAKVRIMRRKAKNLIKASPEEQQVLFDRLQRRGFEVKSIADILGLTKNDYLNRRLQTIVALKGIAPTVKTARQLITHKKILVDGKVVNTPSYIVPVSLENKITLKQKVKKENPKEEVAPEAAETEEVPAEEAAEEKKE